MGEGEGEGDFDGYHGKLCELFTENNLDRVGIDTNAAARHCCTTANTHLGSATSPQPGPLNPLLLQKNPCTLHCNRWFEQRGSVLLLVPTAHNDTSTSSRMCFKCWEMCMQMTLFSLFFILSEAWAMQAWGRGDGRPARVRQYSEFNIIRHRKKLT